MTEEDRYRFGFYRLLEDAAGCEHQSAFSMIYEKEREGLRDKAEQYKKQLLVHFGAAKDALGLGVASQLLTQEARELARLYSELADYADEIAATVWEDVGV